MKDHIFREAVNELRDLAKTFGGTQQLRERIAYRLRAFAQDVLKESPDINSAGPLSEQLSRIACGGLVHEEDAEAVMEAAVLLRQIKNLAPVGKILSEEEIPTGFDRRMGKILWFGETEPGPLFQLPSNFNNSKEEL